MDMTTRLAAAKQRVIDAHRDLQQLAVAEVTRGVSIVRVAREIGHSRQTIATWVRDAGYPTPSQSPAPMPMSQDDEGDNGTDQRHAS